MINMATGLNEVTKEHLFMQVIHMDLCSGYIHLVHRVSGQKITKTERLNRGSRYLCQFEEQFKSSERMVRSLILLQPKWSKKFFVYSCMLIHNLITFFPLLGNYKQIYKFAIESK